MAKEYDVAIIGAGVTGTAILYVLSNYTNVKSIALIEKYPKVAEVNSKSNNNSQTLHFGDIETNYTVEKAAKVKKAADMVKIYIEKKGRNLFNKTSKMVLAVGDEEADKLEKRYHEFRKLFPQLKIVRNDEIAKIEPNIVKGRNKDVKLLALTTTEGYAVNYQKLSESFIENSLKIKKEIDIFLDTKVLSIKKEKRKYTVKTNKNEIKASMVVVCAGSHSLLIAQEMGYGKEFGLLPVAGSFYCAKNALNGKVYTLQMKKLPFAAIHGDPDVINPKETRFGPTAKVLPLLERHNYKTFPEFLKTSSFTIDGVLSLIKILSDKIILKYVIKNFIMDMPVIGKMIFIREVRKIVPSIKLSELKFGKGIGGIRPQVVDTKAKKLNMGEAKITGDNIIFNITPSPGASVCLKNAENDTVSIIKFLGKKFKFDQRRFNKDFRKNLY